MKIKLNGEKMRTPKSRHEFANSLHNRYNNSMKKKLTNKDSLPKWLKTYNIVPGIFERTQDHYKHTVKKF